MPMLWKVLIFCDREGIAPTRFGRLAVRDPRLVHDMRRGRRIGADLGARIDGFIARGRT